MSVQNFIILPDRIIAIVDGASLDRDGNFAGFVNKVQQLPALNTIVVATGLGITARVVAHFIETKATSFDELVANAAEIMETAVAYTHDLLGTDPGADLIGEIHFAGFSDKRNRAEHCFWQVYDKTFDNGNVRKKGLYQQAADFQDHDRRRTQRCTGRLPMICRRQRKGAGRP